MIYSSQFPRKLAYPPSQLKIKSKEINFYVLSKLSALQEDHNESHFIFPQNQKSENQFNNGRWSQEEHQKFIEALFIYGNDWKKVQKYIITRTATQSRSHAQKFFIYFRKKFVDLYGNSKLIQKEEAEDNEGLFDQILNVLIEMPNCENIARFCKGINDVNNKSIENIKTAIINQFSLSSKGLIPFLEERKKKFIKVIISLIQNSTINAKGNKNSVYGMNTQNENFNISNRNSESMNNINELFKINFDELEGKTHKNEDYFELSVEDIPNFFSSTFL